MANRIEGPSQLCVVRRAFGTKCKTPSRKKKTGDVPNQLLLEDTMIFLLKTLCIGHGQRDVSLDLDEEMILFLLGDEANHLPVMEALSCLLDYDLDMRDVESGLEYDSEVEDVRQIVAQLRLIK